MAKPHFLQSAPRLANATLPDRSDFKAYGDDFTGRVRAWRGAVAESQRLADEFAVVVRQASIEAAPRPPDDAARPCAAQQVREASNNRAPHVGLREHG